MYRQFYRLDRMPFEDAPDPEFLHLSGHHGEVLASLIRAVASGKEWTLIAGEAGSGKTTLLQALVRELNPNVIVIQANHPQTGFEGIVYDLSRQLSIHFIDQSNPVDTCAKLKFRLAQVHKGGRRAVLIIDEAHLLDEASMTSVRLLSNHVNENRILLQFVLAGRREIHDPIWKGPPASLKQRIPVNFDLKAMEIGDVEAYIRHRLRVAGGKKPLFDPEALLLIREESGGVPRVVNLLCDNALLIGHALGSRKIDAGIIQKVAGAIETGCPPISFLFDQRMRHPGRTLFIALVSFLVLFLIDGYISNTDVMAPTRPAAEQASPIRNKGTVPSTSHSSHELDDLSFLTGPAFQHKTARGRLPGCPQRTTGEGDIRTAPPRWSLSGPRRSSPPG